MGFSVRSIHRLIKGQGDKRVSEQAAIELGQELQQYAEEVAQKAATCAQEEGYQTVKDRHIRAILNEQEID